MRFEDSLPILYILSFLSISACSPARIADEPELTRDSVRQIIRQGREIVTTRGVHDFLEIEVGGIDQWISVRGRDRRNPILLFIHGGPGATEMPASWFYQGPLEDYFVVVQWDQRGSGKTANSNVQSEVVPTITFERMVNDSEEVVSYLRSEYNKDKLFVLGHSWGSLLGLELAIRHPDWLHAYVGMGQVISSFDNEAIGYRFALDEARRRDDTTAIHELEAIAPYPRDDGTILVQDVMTQRKWILTYGGMSRGRANLDYETNLRLLSPDYSNADLNTANETIDIVMQLLPQLGSIDYRGVTNLDVPVFLFSGRHDYATPSELSFAWFENLEAPRKEFIWFEHSAHMIQYEQPGKFVYHLIGDVRTIAENDKVTVRDDATKISP